MSFRSTVLRATAWIALAASLVSCGGSSNGLVAFVPSRILVFGDESSVITADGRKYTINALDDEGTINCVANPIWTQWLASSYSLAFPECPGTSTTPPTSRILAKAGATAGGTNEIDLTQQVTRQLELPVADGGGISSSDMVTVLIGVNDVVAAFERYRLGLASSAEAQAQVEAAGVVIGTQVNRIVDAGGKVILSAVPNVCFTPYGVANRTRPICDEGELLTFLTLRLNQKLQVTFTNNGRNIGYIQINTYLSSVVANPTYYLYVNALAAACVPPEGVPGWTVLDCTDNTLQPGATAYNWLWADALQLSPGGHEQLGNLASSRAQNQPF